MERKNRRERKACEARSYVRAAWYAADSLKRWAMRHV